MSLTSFLSLKSIPYLVPYEQSTHTSFGGVCPPATAQEPYAGSRKAFLLNYTQVKFARELLARNLSISPFPPTPALSEEFGPQTSDMSTPIDFSKQTDPQGDMTGLLFSEQVCVCVCTYVPLAIFFDHVAIMNIIIDSHTHF